ncbi:MAG: hypothetical protein U0575_11740 [Phycisphaerales bacterium]|jgi:hypothetical protein
MNGQLRSNSSSRRSAARVDDLFGLGISVLLFGYFGFFTSWADNAPAMAHLFKWTLRLSAIGFAIAALLLAIGRREGNLVAGVVGLLGSAAFLVVLILDVLDDQWSVGLHPVILLAFALWNAWVSVGSIRAWRADARIGP